MQLTLTNAGGASVKSKPTKIILLGICLSIVIWLMGYSIAPDKKVFLMNMSWIYQVFWLPVHLICAFYAIRIYQIAVESCKQSPSTGSARKYLSYFLKKLLISTFVVIPFLIMDGIDGYQMVIEQYIEMGQSGWLMLGIWSIEWIATGFLWIHVLLTLKLTIEFYSEEYVLEHLDQILLTNKNLPLLIAGVQNSVVIFIYGLATFGYIFLVGGEASDFVALGISAIFVLIAFLGGLLILKIRLEKALDDECEKQVSTLNAQNSFQDLQTVTGFEISEQLAALNSVILEKPPGISKKSYARLRLMKAVLLLSTKATFNKIELNKALFKYNEYEIRLSTIGMTELRAVLIRLAAPASGILAKLGVFTLH